MGVHLALNSEWKGYRWGPVLGKEAVPTLVDSVGYFTPSTEQFLARKYDLGEVERELSTQVERALKSGLKISYVDYHMGTAVATPQLPAVGERIAAVGDATKDPRPPSYRTGWLGGRFFFGGEPFRDGGSADEELPWNTDERDRPPDSTHQGS